MVVTRKCNDPANKPPTHFCPIANIHGGVITGFYGNVIVLVCSLDGEMGAYPGVCACLRYLYVPTCMSAIIIIHGCVHPETDVSCSSMQRRRSRLHQRKAIQLLAQVGSTVSTDSWDYSHTRTQEVSPDIPIVIYCIVVYVCAFWNQQPWSCITIP